MIERPEPEDWAQASWKTRRRFYAELDVLLKAIERYFDPENHPHRLDKDYAAELGVVKDACLRVLSVIECIMPEDRRNAYWFHKFAEERLLPESRKGTFRDWMHEQDTLEKSIFLLYDSMINLKSVITELLRGSAVSYSSFSGIGRIISRDIRANRHLSPFRREINLEFDVIRNPEISAIVRGIGDRQLRRLVSTVFLYLFRFLRYLGMVDLSTQRAISLHAGYLMLLLLRSEARTFMKHLEALSQKTGDEELSERLDSAAYQLRMEQKRVFGQELMDFLQKPPSKQRGKIENSHGILKNLIEQIVILLAQRWKPSIRGEDIFDSFVTRFEQSCRLREDVAVLHRILGLIGKKAAQPRHRAILSAALRSFMEYFESFTFRLLRHDDYEEFAAFFADIGRLLDDEPKDPDRLAQKCAQFGIFLETALRHIENRAELRGRPLDPRRVDDVIKQYITA